MFDGAWIRLGLFVAAAGCFVAATTRVAESETRAHGQHLLAQYRLPPETITRYAQMAAGATRNALPRENSVFADRSPWIGPMQRAGAGHNPYTLVFTVSGVAKAAGEVYAQWQTGWEIHETPVASREVLMAAPPLARTHVVAGQELTLSASSAQLSFRGERSVAPMLGLVHARNFSINDVQLQVWSGAAPLPWERLPWSRAALVLLGLVCLLLGWRVKHAQPIAQERVVQPARSPELADAVHAAPSAVAAVETAPAVDPSPPAVPSPEARVIADLHRVLTFGSTVNAVLDEARMQRLRAA